MLRKQMREMLAAWLTDSMQVTRQPDGKRWTLLALAKASGVSRDTLWRMQNEKSDADEATVARIAAAMKQPTPWEVPAAEEEMPELPPMPKTEGRSVRDLYTLAVNEVMEWRALSPGYKNPAQRAMQWFEAMKDAAQKEREEVNRERLIADAALREELATVRGELDRLRGAAAPERKPRQG